MIQNDPKRAEFARARHLVLLSDLAMAEHSGSIVGLTASHNNNFLYSHDLTVVHMHAAK